MTLTNEQRKEIDRWEALLDTVYIQRRVLVEIHLHPDDHAKLSAYVSSIGYAQAASEIAADPPHIWDVPIILDPDCPDVSHLVYQEGKKPRFVPEPPTKTKPVDTWIDKEV